MADEPGVWWVDQLNNHDAASGYHALGDEIWAGAGGGPGAVTAFVHGVGTAHSFMGTVEALRRHSPDLLAIAVEPAESRALSGGATGPHRIEGMGIGFVPALWDPSLASEIDAVSSEDAQTMARRLARHEAVFGGASTGANVVVALRVAERLGAGHTVATLQVDTGLKYLSTAIYREA
jgi:cysteine synthase A